MSHENMKEMFENYALPGASPEDNADQANNRETIFNDQAVEASADHDRKTVHLHAPSNADARSDGEISGDNKEAPSSHHDDDSAIQSPHSPKQSLFQLPKRNSRELLLKMNGVGRAENYTPAYVVPRISSSLRSYTTTWAKYKAASRNPQNTLGNRFDNQIEERFRSAIVLGKVDIRDGSITGKYAGAPLTPYGFEPSTESACKQEDYPIIKIEMGEITEGNKQKLSPLAYYQTYDAASMRYEPMLKGSSPNPTGVKRLFPLGAAAADTRSALLSFMGARTAQAGLSTQQGNQTFQQSFLGMNEMNQSSEMSSQNGYTIGNHCSQKLTQESYIPDKVIVSKEEQNVALSIASSETGGKKIENVWKKKLVQRADKSRRRSRESNSDNQSHTDSSSMRALDTDSKSESSSLRRTKRRRTSRKKYE